MKTGNIILFSIMGSFSILIIAGALELRLFGKLHDGKTHYSPNTVREVNATLQPFQVLVIRESINIAIEKSDSLSFQVFRNKNESAPRVKFHQSADTLFIDQVAFGENGNNLHAVIKLKDAQLLKTIRADHSTFSIDDFDGKSLVLSLNESRLYVTSELHLSHLRISAIDSYISYNGDVANKLEADLNHSEVYIQGDVFEFNGTIKNDSDLRLQNVNQIHFKKDSTSSVQIIN